MPAARNLYMLPTTNQSIYSTPLDKDDRMYRSITTRHYPPSPPNTSQPSTPLMTPATTSVASSRRASLQGKPYCYYTSSIHTPSKSTSASTTSIPSPKMSKQDEDSTGNSSPFFNLEKVVQQYGEQRDLLELILSSKVEEDRRRAEEAKLRQKEIDYLLQQHRYDSDNTTPESGQQQQQQPIRASRSNSMGRRPSIDKSAHGWETTDHNTSRRFSDTASLAMNNSNNNNSGSSVLPRIRSPQSHQSGNQDSAVSNSPELTENWRDVSTWDHQPRHQEQQSQEHSKTRRKSTNNIDSLLSHSPKPVSAILPPISTPTKTSSVTSPTIPHHHHHHQPSAFNIPSINHVTSPREDNTNRST